MVTRPAAASRANDRSGQRSWQRVSARAARGRNGVHGRQQRAWRVALQHAGDGWLYYGAAGFITAPRDVAAAVAAAGAKHAVQRSANSRTTTVDNNTHPAYCITHGGRQQQDSSMAPLGLGSARHCQLSSAQLSSHHGPWMANDSPRSRAWVWALRHQPRAGSPSRARDSCTPTGRPSSDSCTPTGRPSSLAADGDPSRRLGTARPHCSGRPSCQRRLPSVREAHSGG